MNLVVLSGFLGRDVKLFATNSGVRYGTTSLAVKKGEGVQFIPLTVFISSDKQEKFISEAWKKGVKLTLSGSLDYYSKKGDDGKYTDHASVIVADWEFAERKGTASADVPPAPQGFSPVTDEVIPFN